jgi:hypothetical protein
VKRRLTSEPESEVAEKKSSSVRSYSASTCQIEWVRRKGP